MLGKFKFIFHICAMKETLDFFIVKVYVKRANIFRVLIWHRAN